MSILNNAVGSIQIGVEDYQSSDERRMLSAVRNVTAGILLLYKVKLCELSPDYDKELLIKTDIRPHQDKAGDITFRASPKNKKTVNVQQIKERFKSLDMKVEWETFNQINSIRTDIEHYYTNEPDDAIRELLAKAFVLIKNFTQQHLQEEPVDLLGNSCWEELLNISEVYESEKQLCMPLPQNLWVFCRLFKRQPPYLWAFQGICVPLFSGVQFICPFVGGRYRRPSAIVPSGRA